MKNSCVVAVSVSLLLVLGGCGTGRSPFTPNVEGDWEISAASTSAGTTDLIQVRLTQSANNANGSKAVLYGEQNNRIHLGGSCPTGNGENSVAIAFANGAPFKFAFNEGSYAFTGTGQYDGGSMSGTYAANPGSGCPDSGNWTAKPTSVLKASFSGSLPGDPNALLQMQITETAANHNVTASGTLSGDITASFSITGSYVGNAISGQVTVNVVNQPPLTKPLNIYYSPINKAIYAFEADGTFDGQFNQD